MKLKQQLHEIGVDSKYDIELSNIFLVEPVVYNQEISTIYISLENPVPLTAKCYAELIDRYQSYTKLKVQLNIIDDNFLFSLEQLQEYLSYFLNNTSAKNLIHFEPCDEEYQLVVYSEESRLLVKELLSYILSCFKNIGFIRNDLQIKIEQLTKNEQIVLKRDDCSDILRNFQRIEIAKIDREMKNVYIEGFIYSYGERQGRDTIVQTINVCQGSDTIKATKFVSKNSEIPHSSKIKNAYGYICGDITLNDKYGYQLNYKSVCLLEDTFVILDDADSTRVELHSHSKMSEMDGVCSAEDLVMTAYKMGLSGLAITDHHNLQAFPSAQRTYSKIIKNDPDTKFKMIYGVEMFSCDKIINLFNYHEDGVLKDLTYVVLDLETTGLSSTRNEIIEFGALKVKDGIILDRLELLIKPEKAIPLFITTKTSISNEMVKNANSFAEEAKQIREFIDGSIIVAHNAKFDFNFLNESFKRCGIPEISNTVIDTLGFAKNFILDRRFFSLGKVAKYFGFDYNEDDAHRAVYDCEVLENIFQELVNLAEVKNVFTLYQLKEYISDDYIKKANRNHVTILIKNEQGVKDLYRLISLAHTDYLAFYGKTNAKKGDDEFAAEPRIPKEYLIANRTNFLIGSSCINNELIELAINAPKDELVEAMLFYDYIEIQPPSSYSPLILRGLITDQLQLQSVLKYIVDTAKSLDKLVVASGDVHYCFAYQKIFRDIYISAKGIAGVVHPLYIRNHEIRLANEVPDAHLLTTKAMLDNFSFLSSELAEDLVINNSKKIANLIENIMPMKSGFYPPTYVGDEEKLVKVCYENAKKQYGDPLPEIVRIRLEKELKSITGNGFSVLYYISHLVVKKSMDDGRLVGSRGSVGSSLVATMTNITEVNPLIPHYYCPNCQYSDFLTFGLVKSGFDLPQKKCPNCEETLFADGQDIPFETFLGFEGDKTPDIDLNFTGEYQETAHNYIREIFGETQVYRAGTISTVQSQTLYGYIKGYYDDRKLPFPKDSYMEFLATNCVGTKRTSGQHPGGIVVIPQNMSYQDFTPYQFPANDANSSWKTTHFDYDEMHDNLVKFDLLAHRDPEAMYMFKQLTGIDPKTLQLNDKSVISLFSSTKALKIIKKYSTDKTGTLGLPEFGTRNTMRILDTTKPTTVADLIAISGISHGSGNWQNNIEQLIKNGTATLAEVIGCRDDIMLYLVSKGIDSKTSFDIMESVRTGGGIKEQWVELLKNNNVSTWYIESARKISYLFPKAHAAAYVIMCLRVAWYKINKPAYFYAVYFTIRCDVYEIETMIAGDEVLAQRLNELRQKISNGSRENPASNKEHKIVDPLEVALEMNSRGYYLSNINLSKSKARDFYVDPDKPNFIIPPFMAIDGLGLSAANSIVEARESQPFVSKKDIIKRTSLNTTLLAKLEQLNCLVDLTDEEQLSLF